MKLQDLCLYLSASDVAGRYNLARHSVLIACRKQRFSEDEAVCTRLGWLIHPDAAQRLWGDRIENKK